MSDTTTVDATTTATAPTSTKVKTTKAPHPVTIAYATLRAHGLTKSSNGESFRAGEFVAVASTARKALGKLAESALAGAAADALRAIRTIEHNAADCLPATIGGANPHHVRIGEVFASVLGFATDARKARNAEVGAYVGGIK